MRMCMYAQCIAARRRKIDEILCSNKDKDIGLLRQSEDRGRILRLPFWFPQGFLGSEGAPAPRPTHALELLELLLRVALGLGVVDELVDQRALASRTGQVVRAPAAEGRVRRQDLADLRSRTSVQRNVNPERERQGTQGRRE